MCHWLRNQKIFYSKKKEKKKEKSKDLDTMAIELESSEERMKTNQKYKLKKTHSLWILNTWFYINFEGAARIPSHHSFTSHALYTYTHLHTINRMKEEEKHFCTTGRKFIISYPSIKPY